MSTLKIVICLQLNFQCKKIKNQLNIIFKSNKLFLNQCNEYCEMRNCVLYFLTNVELTDGIPQSIIRKLKNNKKYEWNIKEKNIAETKIYRK